MCGDKASRQTIGLKGCPLGHEEPKPPALRGGAEGRQEAGRRTPHSRLHSDLAGTRLCLVLPLGTLNTYVSPGLCTLSDSKPSPPLR